MAPAIPDYYAILHDYGAKYASGTFNQCSLFRELDCPGHEFFVVIGHNYPSLSEARVCGYTAIAGGRDESCLKHWDKYCNL